MTLAFLLILSTLITITSAIGGGYLFSLLLDIPVLAGSLLWIFFMICGIVTFGFLTNLNIKR